MPEIIIFFIKWTISLAVVYLFYFLFLRRLTFYNWNRWYLTLYPLLALFISQTDITPWLRKGDWSDAAIVTMVPSFSTYQVLPAGDLPASHEGLAWKLTLIALFAGSLFLLIRLGLQYFSLLRIRKGAKLLFNEGIKVYQVDAPVAPFSFGNAIYINQHAHSEEELKEIIRHEFIHIRQKHTLDILWGECLCIANWFNPFAWLIRKAIRQNLEFIADNKVLENGIDRKQYQYLLLKVVGVSQFSITHPFNVNSLKKRIAMMNKIKSARLHLVKFMFLLPVAAVLLLAFRNLQQNDAATAPPEQLPADMINMELPSVNTDALLAQFYERHPQVQRMQMPDSRNLLVYLRSGTVERYDVSDQAAMNRFAEKYEALPPMPIEPQSGEPVQDCYNSKGYCITVADNQGECVVIVKDRKGKIVEAVTLNDWNDNRAKYEEKYGKIPPPPTPPTAPPPPGAPAPQLPPAPPAPPRLPENVKRINVEDNQARVYLKNGKTETYDLNWKEEKEAFEKKYGKLPVIPPAPPAPGIDEGIIVSPPANNPHIQVKDRQGARTVIRQMPTVDTAGPLYILDGKVLDPGTDLNQAVVVNNIESVQVIKGPEAISAFGDKGRNGVVKIITRNNPKPVSVDLKVIDDNQGDDQVYHLEADTLHVERLENYKGLIMLNGKFYTAKEFNDLKINSEDIKSINVWKGDIAVKKFGEKAREGVIELTLK